jgi:hypothetical protein
MFTGVSFKNTLPGKVLQGRDRSTLLSIVVGDETFKLISKLLHPLGGKSNIHISHLYSHQN